MRPVSIVVILTLAVAPLTARAQSALEQLERKVREASQPAAASEPGYVGLIADDRQTAGQGIRIMEIVSGGPAEKAGLQVGDLIKQVAGQPIHSMNDFGQIVSRSPAETKLALDVERQTKTITLELVLGRRPPPDQRRFGQFGQIPDSGNGPTSAPAVEPRPAMLGVRMASVPPEMQQALGLPSPAGALIVAVVRDSAADKAGISPGDVVLSVDEQPVIQASDLTRLIMAAGGGATVKLSVRQQQNTVTLAVTLETGVAMAGPPPMSQPMAPSIDNSMSAPSPVIAPSTTSDSRAVELEARIKTLEQRVAELERALKNATPMLPAPKSGI